MQPRTYGRTSAAGAALALALAGCGSNAQPQESQQGLFLSSVTQSVCTAENGTAPTFAVNIYDPSCTDLVEGPITVGMTELIDVNELQLGTDGSASGLDGVWVGGDHFQVLPSGDYCVTATPLTGHAGLAPFGTTEVWGTAQNTPVNVPEGGTAETVFAFQCPGDTIAALDIVVLVNEGPSITDFFYGDSGKFVLTCEPGEMNVSWTSPQTDDITITCEAYSAAQDPYVPGDGYVATWSDTVAALAGVEETSTWSFSLLGAGTYHVYCNIENTSGQVTTFQTFLHVNSPAAGMCIGEADGDPLGYISPWPGKEDYIQMGGALSIGGGEWIWEPSTEPNFSFLLGGE